MRQFVVEESANRVYFSKPSLVLRIKSMFVDTVVVILLMIIASQILTFFHVESGVVHSIILGFILLYEPIFVSINRTIGQKVMGLRVRNFSTLSTTGQATNINIIWSLLRFIIKTLLGWVSLLTIHSNTYGKAIHDAVANSVVTLER